MMPPTMLVSAGGTSMNILILFMKSLPFRKMVISDRLSGSELLVY